MRRYFSIEAGYNLFALAATLVIVLILSNQLYNELEFKESEQKLTYLTEANKIAVVLNESFDYIENFDRFLADKIAASTDLSETHISNILGYQSDRIFINIGLLTWILADFVTPNGKIISAYHVQKESKPRFVGQGKRGWQQLTQAQPWVLYLDRPDTGITSGEYIIPTGFGVTSYDSKEFLGTISTGISINKLNTKIIERVNPNLPFVVLNNHLDIIAFSDPTFRTLDFKPFQHILQNTPADEGQFSKPPSLANINFKFYKNMAKRGGAIVLVGIPISQDEYLISHTLRDHFNYALATLLLFIVSLYFFNKILLTPIKQLSENALAIAKGEKFRHHPTIHTKDAAYLSKALDLVEDLLEREHKVNLKLQHTTEQLQEANIVLEQRTEELEQSLKANTEFVNNVSHEVRTPIHGISTLSRGLTDHWEKLDNKTAHTLAIKIASSAQRLLSMVSNLLDVSKLKYGEMHLSFHQVSLNKLALEMIEECRNLYVSDKKIKLKLEEEASIEAFVDHDKITQVLRNLLSNAIKVSDLGTITVGVKQRGKFAQISVADEGIGIPDNELKLVFDAFAQSSRTKGKFSGIGLGLTISQKIIEAHGGTIWCENVKPRGAKFIFTLPLPEITISPKTKPQPDRKALVASTSRINLMIIDDEDTCILGVQMLTHGSNYTLFEYTNPNEALKFLQSNPKSIDVVMIDMMMPQTDGLEVLKAIKADPGLAHIVAIIQSGIADEKQINDAWNNGAADFLRKPYTLETFIDSIERAWKKRR